MATNSLLKMSSIRPTSSSLLHAESACKNTAESRSVRSETWNLAMCLYGTLPVELLAMQSCSQGHPHDGQTARGKRVP